MKARLEKKLTQAQLAQARAAPRVPLRLRAPPAPRAPAPHAARHARAACADAQQINELPKIVQDYEAGKAIPNQAVRAASRAASRARASRAAQRLPAWVWAACSVASWLLLPG
jgi:hypothetical protein